MFEEHIDRLVAMEVNPMARKIVRDAGNGQFVKASEATRRPKSTVTETVKTPKKK